MDTLRVGVVGLGDNTRNKHVPGLRACENVEIVAVCNRRPESTRAAAQEFNIPTTHDQWRQLVDDPQVDAVVIGTWPYLHAPITCAALERGKHVLTEARMARNAAEARQMLAASEANPQTIAQIVPSPFGLRSHQTVVDLIADGYLGDIREVVVLGANDSLLDPSTPLHWRQSAELSGVNMLALGILHEALVRWVDDPIRVLARTQTFVPQRTDPETSHPATVERPDSVHVLSDLPSGATCLYHLSGAMRFGPGFQIQLYGTKGVLKCVLAPEEKLFGAQTAEEQMQLIEIPAEKQGGWRVEEEFVNAIRGRESIQFTTFAAGVRYMEFTEAVARSADSGSAVELPL